MKYPDDPPRLGSKMSCNQEDGLGTTSYRKKTSTTGDISSPSLQESSMDTAPSAAIGSAPNVPTAAVSSPPPICSCCVHNPLCKYVAMPLLYLIQVFRSFFQLILKLFFRRAWAGKEKGPPQRRCVTNAVYTAKYSLLTFLPKCLAYQFSRFANIYFLGIGMLQLSPPISDSNGLPTALVPLGIVILVSSLKEAFEDLRRHRSDAEENNRMTQVCTPQGVVRRCWGDLRVGDIVKIEKGERIPADLVVLGTSGHFGVSYVETKNLDGETNLKHKYTVPTLGELFSSDERACMLEATIQSGAPSDRLYEFSAVMVSVTERNSVARQGDSKSNVPSCLCTEPDHSGSDNIPDKVNLLDQPIPLGLGQFVMRGSSLCNTAHIYGHVVFVSQDTRIFMNGNSKATFKWSHLERTYNRHVLVLVLFELVLCLIIATQLMTKSELPWYLGKVTMQDDPFDFDNRLEATLRVLGSMIILFAYFVPLDLFLLLEITRLLQALFVTWDTELCLDPETAPTSQAAHLLEELGNVTHIYTDKTGTLTQNIMVFRAMGIGPTLIGTSPDGVDISQKFDRCNSVETYCAAPNAGLQRSKTMSPDPGPSLERKTRTLQAGGAPKDWRTSASLQVCSANSGADCSLETVDEEYVIHQPLNRRQRELLETLPSNVLENNASSLGNSVVPGEVCAQESSIAKSSHKSEYLDAEDPLSRRTRPFVPAIDQLIVENAFSNLSVFQLERVFTGNEPGLREFMLAIALCHTVLVREVTTEPNETYLKPSGLLGAEHPIVAQRTIIRRVGHNWTIVSPSLAAYDASSPDELSLVSAAQIFGVELLRRPTLNTVQLRLLTPFARTVILGPELAETWEKWAASEPVPALSCEEIASINEDRKSVVIQRQETLAAVADEHDNFKAVWLCLVEFELLDVLEFDNDRKRMSVIVRDRTLSPEGVTLVLTKGADEAMFEAAAAAPNLLEGGHTISQDAVTAEVEHLARNGLRTLVMGSRILSKLEYDIFHENFNLFRAKMFTETADSGNETRQQLSKLQAYVERDLNLLGCTGVEDRLQEDVPEVLEDFRSCGITVWLLTGDKPETAINIGYSTLLLSKTGFNVVVDECDPGKLKKRLESIRGECNRMGLFASTERKRDRASEQKNNYNMCTACDGSKSSLHHKNCPVSTAKRHAGFAARSDGPSKDFFLTYVSGGPDADLFENMSRENSSFPPATPALSSIVMSSVETLENTGEIAGPEKGPETDGSKEALEYMHNKCMSTHSKESRADHTEFALIVTGAALNTVFSRRKLLILFFSLARRAKVVIACRVAPKQKALLIRYNTAFTSHCISTLAVGDGSNDVPMILAASVGVGIAGKEGLQARRAADFSVPAFKCLRKLLLVHGREALRRNSFLIYYGIFKNIAFCSASFVYQFVCGFSGQDIYNFWLKSLFGSVFIAPSIILYCAFDRELPHYILQRAPVLYCSFSPVMWPVSASRVATYFARLFTRWGTIWRERCRPLKRRNKQRSQWFCLRFRGGFFDQRTVPVGVKAYGTRLLVPWLLYAMFVGVVVTVLPLHSLKDATLVDRSTFQRDFRRFKAGFTAGEDDTWQTNSRSGLPVWQPSFDVSDSTSADASEEWYTADGKDLTTIDPLEQSFSSIGNIMYLFSDQLRSPGSGASSPKLSRSDRQSHSIITNDFDPAEISEAPLIEINRVTSSNDEFMKTELAFDGWFESGEILSMDTAAAETAAEEVAAEEMAAAEAAAEEMAAEDMAAAETAAEEMAAAETPAEEMVAAGTPAEDTAAAETAAEDTAAAETAAEEMAAAQTTTVEMASGEMATTKATATEKVVAEIYYESNKLTEEENPQRSDTLPLKDTEIGVPATAEPIASPASGKDDDSELTRETAGPSWTSFMTPKARLHRKVGGYLKRLFTPDLEAGDPADRQLALPIGIRPRVLRRLSGRKRNLFTTVEEDIEILARRRNEGKNGLDLTSIGMVVMFQCVLVFNLIVALAINTMFWFQAAVLLLTFFMYIGVWALTSVDAIASAVPGLSKVSGTYFLMLRCPAYYFCIFLSIGTALLPVATCRAFRIFFKPTAVAVVKERMLRGVFDIVIGRRPCDSRVVVLVPLKVDSPSTPKRNEGLEPSFTEHSAEPQKGLRRSSGTANTRPYSGFAFGCEETIVSSAPSLWTLAAVAMWAGRQVAPPLTNIGIRLSAGIKQLANTAPSTAAMQSMTPTEIYTKRRT